MRKPCAKWFDVTLQDGMFSDGPSQNVVYTDRIPMTAVLTTRIVGRYVAVIGVQVPVEDFEAHTPRVLELINSVTIDPTVDSFLTKK